MSSIQQLVREFHETFDAPIAPSFPKQPDYALAYLRLRLIEEELNELQTALLNHDPIEAADALGDLAYVVYGAALAYGIDLDAVVREIHRSNMTKLMPDGTVAYRKDGKVLKGPNFEQPNLQPIIFPSTPGRDPEALTGCPADCIGQIGGPGCDCTL